MNVPTTSIYRSDHILGLVDGDLSVDLYRSWGRAFAHMLPERSIMAVSSDLRKSSEEFRLALIEALTLSGVQVYDLGTLPSDLASYGAETVGAAGFACVTGGPWPAQWNGLCWQLSNCSLSMAEQVDTLRTARQDPMVAPTSPSVGACRQLDITYSWVSWLQSIWYDTPNMTSCILLDPTHGNWSGLALKTLQTVFPHLVIEAVRNEPLGDFGGLDSPSRCPDALEEFCAVVEQRHAGLGVAFDVDAGLFMMVDGNGVPLRSGELSFFFLRDLLGPALEGENFLHDVNCPRTVVDEGIRWGATPISVCRGDHSFITAMKKANALIGLGSEGEIYFRGAQGNRIVLFAVCWLFDYLAVNGMELAEWRKTFPSFYTTPEIRTASASPERITDRLTEAWAVAPKPLVEGVRFSLPGGRLHVRPIPDFSQTGFYFEADDRPALDRIVAQTVAALNNLEHVGPFLETQYGALTAQRAGDKDATPP